MVEVSTKDDFFMERALSLAKLNAGKTAPNPWVGAVLVKYGRIIGEGFHKGAGFPHAEVSAIQDARRKGIDTKGAKMYVSLQPCNSFGRTPPCTLAIEKAGIKEVIFSVEDPNIKNQWRIKEGIKVKSGVLREKGERVLLPYLVYIREKKPYVILKLAQTLDGKISDFKGNSKYITSAESLEEVHILRSKTNFIVIGRETLEIDNPKLNARVRLKEEHLQIKEEIGGEYPSPVKVIIDPKFRAFLSIKRDVLEKGTAKCEVIKGNNVIFVGQKSAFVGQSTKVISSGELNSSAGAKNLSFFILSGEVVEGLLTFIRELGGIVVLVEGGGKTAWEFLKSGKVDEIHLFYAPSFLGGGRTIQGDEPREISSPVKTEVISVEMKGKDILVKCSQRGELWEYA